MFKIILLLAVIAGGAYWWYTQNPTAFNGAANTISSDTSKAESKAKTLR